MKRPGWRPIRNGVQYRYRAAGISVRRGFYHIMVCIRKLPSWIVPAGTGLMAIVLMLLLFLGETPAESSRLELVKSEPGTENQVEDQAGTSQPDPFAETDTERELHKNEPADTSFGRFIGPANEESAVEEQTVSEPADVASLPIETAASPWNDLKTGEPATAERIEVALQPELALDSLMFRIEMNPFSGSASGSDELFAVSSRDAAAQEFRRPINDVDVGFEFNEDSTLVTDDRLWIHFKPDRHAKLVVPAGYESQFKRDSVVVTTNPPASGGNQPETPQKRIDISISRNADDELGLNQLSTYFLFVENHSDSVIEEVSVDEHVPANYRIVEVVPEADFDSRILNWKLRNLYPNEKRQLSIKVFALAEGEFRNSAVMKTSAAVVQQTSVREMKTQLAINGPQSVPAGRMVSFEFDIENSGPATVPSATLRVTLSDNLNHRGHRKLVYPVNSLAAGESRTAILSVRAESMGTGVAQAELVIGPSVLITKSKQIAIVKAAAKRNPATPTRANSCRCSASWSPTLVR